MLTGYFDSAARIRALRAGPAGEFIESFADTLSDAGYAEITARRHLRAAEHLAYWTDQRGISVRSLGQRHLEAFGRHLRQCRCPHYCHADRGGVLHGARLFLEYLQDAGIIPHSAVDCPRPEPAILTDFRKWMQRQRGSCSDTLDNYSIPIRDLLARFGEDPSRYDARSLRELVVDLSRKSGWAATKRCTTALRMFLRFLIAEGRCSTGLDAAVPSIMHRRLAELPRYLQSEDVERLIASCDPGSIVGRRDRAILLLLARLGLRAGDIVELHLADIDWKDAWIHVCGKGRIRTQLPLTQEVGQAIAEYLQAGRPQTEADAVFVRSRAPFTAFGSHCAISVIVARALQRAGVTRPSRGAAHLLRHSLATSMLRQGASLQDISAVLRHRSIETTQIYAKVDVTALGRIAQPWPEVGHAD